MRILSILLAGSIAGAAAAQSVSGDSSIVTALNQVRLSDTLLLNLAGTEKVGGITTNVTYETSWDRSFSNGEYVYKIQIVGYRGAHLFLRLVADGGTLWRYDIDKNQYSATVYGNAAGASAGTNDALGKLFRTLSAVQDGYSAFPVTLLKQTYAAAGVAYESWLPGAIPFTDASGNVVYSVGNPARRTITFYLDNGSLASIGYSDVMTLDRMPRDTDWNMTAQTGTNFDPAIFVFVPPVGAQPIVGPRIN